MSMTSKREMYFEKIPPTADTASSHSYRVYLQAVYWKKLMRADTDATSWG